MSNCEYARYAYGVPACIGRIVAYKDRQGVIAEDQGHYIGVTFDDEKPGTVHNVHPTDDNLEYRGMGKVRPMTRSQRRYRRYLDADSGLSFAEWLRYE